MGNHGLLHLRQVDDGFIRHVPQANCRLFIERKHGDSEKKLGPRADRASHTDRAKVRFSDTTRDREAEAS
jgi:hypothetical protein